MDKNEILKKYFGYDSFRSGQAEVVDSIISGRDTLCVMPTGAGKSLCYQIPALMMGGITLVISPLISLMQDQVSALVQSGVRAAYINSSLTQNQICAAINNARKGIYKLIYVAPERLLTDGFLSFAKEADISMITVDEAHCISQWGQDFRPSYLDIPEFAEQLPKRPVITAFTATATGLVRDDICSLLQLDDPYTLVTGFDRKNLYFEVRRPSDKYADLKRLVTGYDKEGRSGIIYCSTRKNVEEVCQKLCDSGFSATRYHAGLSEEERRVNQEDFICDRKRIIVATNAFGMGIDKSNVTYVVHYNMPKDVESYYQEAGRAGRDGSPSECVLLYSGSDVVTGKFLINKSFEESELDPDTAYEIKKRDLKRLKDMTLYCTCGGCLRRYILRYFGEKAPDECGSCSVCCSDAEETDITVESQKILSCIFRGGQKYGITLICDVLRGSENEKIKRTGLDKLTTYGIMKDVSERRIRAIADKLESSGYIERTDGDYPVLRLKPAAADVLKGKVTVMARLPEENLKPKKEKKQTEVYASDPALMQELKALRAKLAAAQGVPAYIVFTDATLRDMCEKRPRSKEEFLDVSGVGAVKYDRYGDSFISLITEYDDKNPAEKNVIKAAVNRMKTPEEAESGLAELVSLLDRAEVSDEDISTAALADMLVASTGANIAAASLRRLIKGRLISEGYLKKQTDSEGKEIYVPTAKGGAVGIYGVSAASLSGKIYFRVLCTPEAQRFIIDDLKNITDPFGLM